MTIFGRLDEETPILALEIGVARLTAVILTHGARLHLVCHAGSPNLVVGSHDLAGYLGSARYAGPIVGPVVNRIAGAKAMIGSREYQFEKNENGRNCLHSGHGSQDRVWTVDHHSAEQVKLSLELADGDGGFPGNRQLTASYQARGDTLELTLAAKTDALTLINLAHHGVWNLDGRPSWDGHRLLVESDLYLPTDTEKIPLGETAPVAGTAFDHRALAPIDPGLDHNFCFEPTGERRRLARLVGPSGRALEVVSNAPGLQVYAGGVAGIALEPQLWPDAPHHPAFPSILLQPGMEFSQVTLFRLFSPK